LDVVVELAESQMSTSVVMYMMRRTAWRRRGDAIANRRGELLVVGACFDEFDHASHTNYSSAIRILTFMTKQECATFYTK